MYTLPRKHLRSSDIPAGAIADDKKKRKNVLLYLGIFFLTALTYPIASEIYDDLVCQSHPGLIESKVIASTGSLGHQTFLPIVLYKYSVAGKTFYSEKLFGGNNQLSFANRNEAENVLGDLSENAECTVYVDPSNPSRSFLKKIYQQSPDFFLNGLLGFTIAGALIIIATISPFKPQ